MEILVFILLILATPVFAEDKQDCRKTAKTTIDINQCMTLELDEVENVMDKYLAKALERYSDDSVSLKSIEESQKVWLQYRSSHCGAVYDTWRDGSIRTTMALSCDIELVYQRTRVLWSSFLTFPDSTPPLLPEPQDPDARNR